MKLKKIEVHSGGAGVAGFCSAFGKTEEKVLEEVKIAMELWINTAKKEGRDIPHPHSKELLNVLYETAFRTTCAEGLACNIAYAVL